MGTCDSALEANAAVPSRAGLLEGGDGDLAWGMAL